MRKLTMAAAAIALMASANVASAQIVTGDKAVSGTITSTDGGLQLIRLDNGHEFVLGTHHTLSEFKKGDKVTVNWKGYAKGYMEADKVRVQQRDK